MLGSLEILQFLPQGAPNVVTLLCIQNPNKHAAELGGKQTVDLLCVYLSPFICSFSRKEVRVQYVILNTTNSREQSTFVKLIVAQLVKQFAALYGT